MYKKKDKKKIQKDKKKYIQKKDKKKKCPLCKSLVFNATIICTGIDNNGLKCLFMHRNKRTPEHLRDEYNSLVYKDKLKCIIFKNKENKIDFKKINDYSIKNENKIEIYSSNIEKSFDLKINFDKFKNNLNTPKKDYKITKKTFSKNMTFIKETNKLRTQLFNQDDDNIFVNLNEIESI